MPIFISVLFIAFVLFLSPFHAGAAETEAPDLETSSTAAQQTPEEASADTISGNQNQKIFTLVIENDSIGGRGTDKNYTSGVRFGYLDSGAEMPAIAYKIDDYIPTFEINDSTSVFYSFGQNLYTPSDITNPAPNPNDRPWAAHLYGAIGLATATDDHVDEVEVSLGVVGPWALGKQTQTFVHKYITDSPKPEGWSNQLKNEPAIVVAWQRRHPQYLSQDFVGLNFAAAPHYGVTLGNVYTFANAGFNLSVRPSKDMWQDAPVRVRPALPGTGFFDVPENDWSWYLFAGVDVRAVARNIFLDGNTFRSSSSVDKRYLVGDANAGVAVTYGRYRLSYTLVYRTKEFYGQDDPSVFGALSLGYRF
ncbi:MAG: lipid A deacylase LpxR family protein [Alphaproteobacteria bacterium]|nr:MAG: lipid A deacylase LpxR family protein [Alphaproteobacteria bacterium]